MESTTEHEGLRGYDSFELKLGDELRGERATRGKSLLDVQRDLRIKAAYIAAIENCDPSVFPNPGFVAGYVRSYARYLKLDPEEIFARFCEESGFTGVNAAIQKTARSSIAGGTARVTTAVIPDSGSPFVVRQATLAARQGFEISPSAIGSIAVLLLLIAGLGFAGMSVLKNIQRVQITPIDQTPGALDRVASNFSGPGIGAQEIDLVGAEPKVPSENRDRDLTRLYEPRELEVPVVEVRDGPIVDIDPGDYATIYRTAEAEDPEGQLELRPKDYGPQPFAAPQVREENGPPTVLVGAQLPAWVRVYLADGTVLFEKTLDKGELYALPKDVDAPFLRAGMSGYVYLVIDGVPHGPVGEGTTVVKELSLLPDDVRQAMAPLEQMPEALAPSVAALAQAQIAAPDAADR